MQILSLKINDIFSIKQAELNFDADGLILVDGWNYDDGRSNGAGKTAIFNSLCFGLYDSVPRKITATEILRRGAKKGCVTVKVKIKDNIYEVTRCRPKNVCIKKNGKELKITHEEWLKILELSYDQFLISMYTAQNINNKFINLNDSGKKDFLLELMKLSDFNACKKESDSIIKKLKNDIDALQNDIDKAKSKITVYDELKVDVDDIKNKIKDIKNQKQKNHKIIIELSNVCKPDISKYDDIEQKTQLQISKLIKVKTTREYKMSEYNRNKKELMDFNTEDTCFNCGAKLDNKKAKKKHEENQDQIKQTLKGILTDIKTYDEQLKKEKQLYELIDKIKHKKNIELKEYNEAQGRLQKIRSQDSILDHNYNSYVKQVEQRKNIDKKIKVLEKFIVDKKQKITKMKKEKEIYETVSALYSPTGALAYTLDSIVESFNENIKKYMWLIWPNASYKLQSYKETKKGDVVAKFSESFTNNGEECSIGSLSGGEYKTLSLIIDFTIINILETQFGMKLSPIILDEPFEGLDNVGREMVIDSLNKISVDRPIWIVDHASEAKTMFSQIIKVEKRNKVSVIVNDMI